MHLCILSVVIEATYADPDLNEVSQSQLRSCFFRFLKKKFEPHSLDLE
jgi:hypothetical protein